MSGAVQSACLLHVRHTKTFKSDRGLCDGHNNGRQAGDIRRAFAHISYHGNRHVKRSPLEKAQPGRLLNNCPSGHDSKQISFSMPSVPARHSASVPGERTVCPRERELIRDKKRRRPRSLTISLLRFLVLVVSQRKIKRTKGLSE